MADRLVGKAATRAGDVVVTFELSPTLAIRSLKVSGILERSVATETLSKLTHAFEGVPLDARILTQVAKRAFKEFEIAVEGLGPEDVAVAILAA